VGNGVEEISPVIVIGINIVGVLLQVILGRISFEGPARPGNEKRKSNRSTIAMLENRFSDLFLLKRILLFYITASKIASILRPHWKNALVKALW
jgi:hypothetical protein